MAQIVGVSALDFAYKGYQYPLPPSWKYAVRVQDQINWLLQAVLALDAAGVSIDDMTAAISAAVTSVTRGYREADANVEQVLNATISALEDRVSEFEDRNAVFRNPVTGFRDYGYVALKQMYDMLRTRAMTWDELAATGMTWDELKATTRSWFDVDMFSNDYWGNKQPRAKYTPADHIDVATPGYVDVTGTDDASIAHSWGEMYQFGFLTRK